MAEVNAIQSLETGCHRLACLIALVFVSIFTNGQGGLAARPVEARVQQKFVITETGQPFSYDPLDADISDNLPVARMLYLTPLEVSADDRLTSSILEKFSYDVATRTSHWTVREGLKFSDGTPISPADVAFAVARMALRRPKFPVIKEIAGIDEWVKSSKPLHSYPKGLKLEGRNISISFVESIDHPLFRFCLELFSIIPRRSVDLDSGKLLTPQPPTSGYYTISARNSDSITFIRRPEFPTIDGKPVPDSIRFVYGQARPLLESAAASIDADTVIATSESIFKTNELDKLAERLDIRNLPKAKFLVLLLNPNTPAFQRRECRQMFASYFREAFAKNVGTLSILEGSISPRTVTGYIPLSELTGSLPSLDEKTTNSCRESLKGHKLKLGVLQAQDSPFQLAIKETLRHFGHTDVNPTVAATVDGLDGLFVKGDVHIEAFSSGMWALDPFGDLQMLFTPGLHNALTHLQGDAKLQAMIAKLRTEMPSEQRIQLAKDLNRHLFEESVFNVYRHSRRFYASKKGGGFRTLNAAITSPTPWQVFERQ